MRTITDTAAPARSGGGTKPRIRWRRRASIVMSAAALTGLVAASPGAASAATASSPPPAPSQSKATVPIAAAPDAAGRYCGVYGTGYTWTTEWQKQPPGCYDLNVVWTELGQPGLLPGDTYAGYYWNGSRWIEGSKGYVYIPGGHVDPNTNPNCVLLTDVATGTWMFIGSGKGEAYINININY
jgi:hypothetical protein